MSDSGAKPEAKGVIPPADDPSAQKAGGYEPSTQKKLLGDNQEDDINFAINERKETETSLNEFEEPDEKIEMEGLVDAKNKIDISWHNIVIKAQVKDEDAPENKKPGPPCKKPKMKEITILKGVSGKVNHG